MVPLVPNPAPAEISPVGFSVTSILITLLSLSDPSLTSEVTSLKKPRDFKLFTDLLCKILLNVSPSSNIKLFLITSSLVMLFPNILILSTKYFSDSSMEILKFNLFFPTIFSSTNALIESYSSFKAIISTSFKIFFIALYEYG